MIKIKPIIEKIPTMPKEVIEEIRKLVEPYASEDVHISVFYQSKTYKKLKK